MLPSLPQQPLSLGTPNAEGRKERHSKSDRTEREAVWKREEGSKRELIHVDRETDMQPRWYKPYLLNLLSHSLFSCHSFFLCQTADTESQSFSWWVFCKQAWGSAWLLLMEHFPQWILMLKWGIGGIGWFLLQMISWGVETVCYFLSYIYIYIYIYIIRKIWGAFPIQWQNPQHNHNCIMHCWR